MFDDYRDKILNCTYVGQGYTGVMFSSSCVYCRVTDYGSSNMLLDVGRVNTLKREDVHLLDNISSNILNVFKRGFIL